MGLISIQVGGPQRNLPTLKKGSCYENMNLKIYVHVHKDACHEIAV